MSPDELRTRLESFLAREVGVAAVNVDGVRQLAGGASRQIWAFDAVYDEGGATVRRPLVLRRDSSGSALHMNRIDEFRLHRAAYAEGVPVPQPLWVADDTVLFGAPSYIMERVEGETLPRRLLRDDAYCQAREVMVGQLASILARVHRIDPTRHGLGGVPAATGDSPALAELDRYEQTYRGIAPEPHPAFELALRWLRCHLPVGGARTLVHGDYRIGNVVFGPEGVRAVLDWEIAHVGDPMEDFGWICTGSWRFGQMDKPVGGFGEREDLWAGYEAAGGAPVSRDHALWWEVYGSMRWGVMCASMVMSFRGADPSVERGVIARRTSENEIDLLRLLAA